MTGHVFFFGIYYLLIKNSKFSLNNLLAHRETTSKMLSGSLGRITALWDLRVNSLDRVVPFSLSYGTRSLCHRPPTTSSSGVG